MLTQHTTTGPLKVEAYRMALYEDKKTPHVKFVKLRRKNKG